MSLIEARGLSRDFFVPKRSAFERTRTQTALEPTDLDVVEGSAVGVIGESGSGKSTLVRLLLGLDRPTSGTVSVDGRRVDATASAASLHWLRRQTGLVFQDPYASLDPRQTCAQIIGEPLWALRIDGDHAQRIREVLEQVGLEPEMADRYPHEFSGGQRQRVGIARALATGPDFLVADEPVSSLDVSIQAQILQLLGELRRDLKLALLFISHDLPVVRHLCDRVVVMYLGRVMEEGPAERVFAEPAHPYTRALISATPRLDPGKRTKRILLPGDPPSPSDPPSGCVFRTRCAHAIEACAGAVPALRPFGEARRVACIRAEEIA